MRFPISQEKGPIAQKYQHWASFLGTRNRLSNARENPFPGGHGLSLGGYRKGERSLRICSEISNFDTPNNVIYS